MQIRIKANDSFLCTFTKIIEHENDIKHRLYEMTNTDTKTRNIFWSKLRVLIQTSQTRETLVKLA